VARFDTTNFQFHTPLIETAARYLVKLMGLTTCKHQSKQSVRLRTAESLQSYTFFRHRNLKKCVLFAEVTDYINDRQGGKLWTTNDRGHQCSYLACA